ncbi:hypothetical protein OG21DRAFT_1517255 [Imleria badia]|nr:hypothetical protein OG21DRAFT_1517255 [Imleria badia]
MMASTKEKKVVRNFSLAQNPFSGRVGFLGPYRIAFLGTLILGADTSTVWLSALGCGRTGWAGNLRASSGRLDDGG